MSTGVRAATKSEVLKTLAEKTSLSKKEVGAVIDGLAELIKRDLKKKNLFTIPGLVKLKVNHRPATKPRMGTNPFTGEQMMFKAKPARKVVRAIPLKALKDSVS